jgi:Trypsin Inhibitor like cysteine rich domain
MCTDPNEEPVLCDNTCEHTCNNNILGMSAPTPCKASPCESGCDCISGYLRDTDGVCVPESECGKYYPTVTVIVTVTTFKDYIVTLFQNLPFALKEIQ